MIYVLETTTCSLLMRKDRRLLRTPSALLPTDSTVTSVITCGEVLYGIERLPAGARRAAFQREADALFGELVIEPVPPDAAPHYARLKWEAERRGVAISDNDLWIAATTLALGAVLVTADADFSRLSGVQLDDWTR